MTHTLAVAGATGSAGGEILRLLLGHPELGDAALRATVASGTSAGQLLGEHHPHLGPILDLQLVATTPQQLNGHDIVILALPHGHSGGLAPELEAGVIVDAAADHRLGDPQAWQAFYGGEHAGTWPYALPELPLPGGGRLRTELPGPQSPRRRVAVPGCYPTAVALAMAPGLVADLVEPEVVVVAASGVSGAGRSLNRDLAALEVIGSMRAYGVGGTHRHTPEMEQTLSRSAGQPVVVSFTPMLAPMTRGILATVSARARPGVDAAQVRDAWYAAYADEPFVRLLPEGVWPRTADTAGANMAHVQVAFDARAGRVVAVSAIDNLVKGTAGAAVQALNIALGIPEATGLGTVAVAP